MHAQDQMALTSTEDGNQRRRALTRRAAAAWLGGAGAAFTAACGLGTAGGGQSATKITNPVTIVAWLDSASYGTATFAVISPILSRPREETPNQVGMTLRIMREEIAAAVAALQAHGDRHLHYVDGLCIMGPQQADLIPGDTHPSAGGYRVMAHRFLQHVVHDLWDGGSSGRRR